MISRAGRVPTGVDRVERAYLAHLSDSKVPLFAVLRTTLGYVLLSPDGVAAIRNRLEGTVPWGPADRLSRLARRKDAAVRQAESDLRRVALDRCRPNRLSRMLKRHLPQGVSYLNVGHSNLTDRMLQAVRVGVQGSVSVLIHDVIPLEYPQYQRPGTPERFRQILKRVRALSDLIIYNTEDTRQRAERAMSEWGATPHGIVAHLGVDLITPGPVPTNVKPDTPYFITIGTIEPRKGHDLLLNVWDKMGPDAPGLLICGNRGWNNQTVFDRLDALPKNGPIQERNGLDDKTLAGLLAGAQALLFPSRAEGYGLPPVEAAALGVPVISTDLPAVREILGDIPVYVKETDCYQWLHSIESLGTGREAKTSKGNRAVFIPPNWQDHFKIVMRSC
nr:glycosyltransferase family 1 protein [Phaeobacter marinintestinus]